MFFIFASLGADAARSNVNRHQRKAIKDELKFILYSIESASRQGYTCLKWRRSIRKANIYTLKDLGYRIYYLGHSIYEIEW